MSNRLEPLLLALKQASAIAKGLFDALKVVPLPALPRPLFLRSRDATAFHAHLCLSILVDEGQGDGSKVPYGKGSFQIQSSWTGLNQKIAVFGDDGITHPLATT